MLLHTCFQLCKASHKNDVIFFLVSFLYISAICCASKLDCIHLSGTRRKCDLLYSIRPSWRLALKAGVSCESCPVGETGLLATEFYCYPEGRGNFFFFFSLSLQNVWAYGCIPPFVNITFFWFIFFVSKILFKKSNVLSKNLGGLLPVNRLTNVKQNEYIFCMLLSLKHR